MHSIHGWLYTYVYTELAHVDIYIILLHKGHILYTAHALTRRDEGVLDSIALDEVAQYAVHTLNDVFVKSLHITHSTDCHFVLCITLNCVHYTR